MILSDKEYSPATFSLAKKVALFFSTISNPWMLLFDKLGYPSKILYKAKGGQYFYTRSNTTDINEAVVVMSGAEYPSTLLDLSSKESPVIVDCGANIGLFSLFSKLQNKNAQIYAVEPLQENITTMQANFAANKIQDIKIFPYAISNEEKEVVFTYEPTKMDGGSLVQKNDQVSNNSLKINVKTKTLRQLFETYQIFRVDLLKMDIEGAEYMVIPESLGYLGNFVDRLIIEYHEGANPNGRNDLVSQLTEDARYELIYESKNILGFVNSRKYQTQSLPVVSYIIPTYNAEKYLERCLDAVFSQSYPKEKYEVIVADGGSNDSTLDILKKYPVIFCHNPKKDCDYGKFIALQKAQGEIIALIDDDNIITSDTWLRTMIEPLFLEKEIIGVESNYLIAKDFSSINTYANLLVIVDPLARMLASRPKITERDGYNIKEFDKGGQPVAGANGFLWKRSIIDKYLDGTLGKFTEANLLSEIASKQVVKYANIPNVGVYHYYCVTLKDYVKKRIKIAGKFLDRKEHSESTWVDSGNKVWFVLSVVYLASFIGPAVEALLNYAKTRRIEWFWHPVIGVVTIFVYTRMLLGRFFVSGTI